MELYNLFLKMDEPHVYYYPHLITIFPLILQESGSGCSWSHGIIL